MLISADETLVVTATRYDSTVLVWDMQTFEVVFELSGNELDGYPLGIDNLEMCSDNSILIAGNWFLGWNTIWDMQTLEKVAELPGEQMALSPDCSYLATGWGRDISHVWVWDAQNGNELMDFQAPMQIVEIGWLSDTQIIANFDDHYLPSMGYDYTGSSIRIWDISRAELQAVFADEMVVNLGVTLSPEETLLGVYFDGGSVFVWNQETGIEYYDVSTEVEPQPYIVTNEINHFVVQPDFSLLAGITDTKIIVWDLMTETIIQRFPYDIRIVLAEAIANSPAIIALDSLNNLSIWSFERQ